MSAQPCKPGAEREAQKDLQRTRIRTAPERQNAGTKLVFNAARARENWLLFGLIFYECRGYCPARRPGVKVKAASKRPEFARIFHFNQLPFPPTMKPSLSPLLVAALLV